MGAMFSSPTGLEIVALNIHVPSGSNKIFYPSLLMDLWPTLPTWFWRPTGVYEITACLLAFVASQPWLAQIGFAMFYVFMGGAMSSLVYIPDDKGYTHAGGNGKFGWAGLGPLDPATLSTALVYYLDKYSEKSSRLLRFSAAPSALPLVLSFISQPTRIN